MFDFLRRGLLLLTVLALCSLPLSVLAEAAALCRRYRCAPVWCESNGDRGYIARELRRLGVEARSYHESQNKYMKIATHLRRWWPLVTLAEGTDDAWLRQILDYSEDAEHDDAPDSAATACRILQARERRRGA